MGQSKPVVLYAAGDIAPDRENPNECFDLVRDRLKEADVAFCQLELVLTRRGSRLPQVRHTWRGDPAIAPALRSAGFNVVSCAGNHCMDWGADGLHDTIAHLKSANLAVAGVGADIDEARRPAIVETNGVRIAFLAYCSILHPGFCADEQRPGCAPMRAHTIYEQIQMDQPGTAARIHTYPHRGDLAALKEDIRKAKSEANVVAVSMHWGIHFVEATIADYQKDVAYAAIDAGADMIIGHHAHILKGVEIYKGAPIVYSLGNFAVEFRVDKTFANSPAFNEIREFKADWKVAHDSPYNFPADSRMTMVMKVVIENRKVAGVSFLPAYVNANAQPEILRAEDEQFPAVLAYLKKITAAVGFATRFEVEGDGIVPLAGT
jgi:poly-gamma-glutamate capsule biosynthesis protein CapA/YwtB (metallophosphatase superfamily)